MNLLFSGTIGLVAGWLVNYLSDVLPVRYQFSAPVCVHCKETLEWSAYLKLAKCPHCGKPRRWRTYLVLAVGTAAAIWLWLSPPAKIGFWLGLLVLAYFGVTLIIDAETHYILTTVSIFGAALALLVGILLHGFVYTLLGGAAGLGIMLTFYLLGKYVARYRAKKMGYDDGEEALGFGDVTLSAVLGLMLGWPRILMGLIFGVFAGGIISLLLITVLKLTKRYESMQVFIAYGPYLIFGAFILLYIPQALTILSGK